MKKGVIPALLAVATVLVSTGCSKDETKYPGDISSQVIEAFNAKYPGVSQVQWQVKGAYAVASFRPGNDAPWHSAWFDNGNGYWGMTETDIPFSALPQEVKTAHREGEYASWRVDDVDMLSRQGMETVYVIEVEQGETEIDLYYSPDGVLIKKVMDSAPDYDYGDYIPEQTTASVAEYIARHYPSARIVEVDIEGGLTEIEIIDGRTPRELLFSASGQWMLTKTELRRHDVPQAVEAARMASEYADYYIDDIDFYETPEGNYYRYDLESRWGDVKVDITPEGVLTLAGNDRPDGSGSAVTTDVKQFIESKYPGAVILEKDYDDGLLEVEIRHENQEKDVYFNGANEWVYTEWDVRYRELPETVIQAIETSKYAHYEVDDLSYEQTPQGDWYRVELEDDRSDREVELLITVDGRILR